MTTGELMMQVGAKLAELEQDVQQYKRWYYQEQEERRKYEAAYFFLKEQLNHLDSEAREQVLNDLTKMMA